MILLATVAASAELAGLVAAALGLVKVLEKTYDHQAGKRARRRTEENGGDPLNSVRRDVADLKVVAAKQVDLSERGLELQERMDRRMEKFAIGQALLLERSSGKSASGERAALGGTS